MKYSALYRLSCFLFSTLLMLSCLSGCRLKAEEASQAGSSALAETISTATDAISTTSSETAVTDTTQPTNDEAAATDPEPCGASYITIFGDRDLPEDGWLTEHQVGFCMEDAGGGHSVIAMEIPNLHAQLAALGNLPRSDYYHQYLDERFDLLLSAFDMALELGCRKFSIPTDTLRARDVSEIHPYLEYTFQIYGACPRYSVTKNLTRADGSSFRFLTVLLTGFSREELIKHCQALARARSIIREMPEGMDELETAKYLYRYVATRIHHYNTDSWDDYDWTDWNCLYDALVSRLAVGSGYAAALSCLFNLAGIDCLWVDGSIVSEKIIGSHNWNCAKVNGSWYLFDATWDSLDDENDSYRPLFFGVSDQIMQFYTVRRLDSFLEPLVPPCESVLDEDYLYFIPPN